MVDQMSSFFESIFSPFLSGFRKSHDCQSVLLRFIEMCKQNLDSGKVCGALTTDLSKAFDCLPHKLVITKLSAYGMDKNSFMMIASYFQGRKQRVSVK